MIPRIIYFLKTGVWEVRLKDMTPVKAFFVRPLRVILLASERFMADHCEKTASVLTYYSLLNIVPVLAVAFAIAKGFGLRKVMEKQVMEIADKASLQPDVTNQILTFSRTLLEQAKGGLIAGVGAILLLWTVISILGKIEEAFNEIWEIEKPRTLQRKFSDYISMMVFGPILIIISGSATVLMTSQVKVILSRGELLGAFSGVVLFLLGLLPYVSIWILLTMVYLVMPNTRISLRLAIMGGVAAGTVAQIVQWVYIKFQIGLASYGAIYGSFAAIPLFLAWVQISWMIALFGAQIAYAADNYETYGFDPDYSRLSVSSRRLLTLRVFHLLAKRFSLGEKPLSIRQIAQALEIPMRLVKHILRELSEVGLVIETAKEVKSGPTFQPAKAVEHVTVKFVLDEFEKCGVTKIPDSQAGDAEKILSQLEAISQAVEKSSANVLLKEI